MTNLDRIRLPRRKQYNWRDRQPTVWMLVGVVIVGLLIWRSKDDRQPVVMVSVPEVTVPIAEQVLLHQDKMDEIAAQMQMRPPFDAMDKRK